MLDVRMYGTYIEIDRVVGYVIFFSFRLYPGHCMYIMCMGLKA